MDIERRLKDHMMESGQRIQIGPDDPAAIINAEPPRSGKVIQAMTAILLIAMAGAGFWVLSDDDDGVTEIAAGEAEEADETEETTDGRSGTGEGDGDGTAVANVELEFVNITSENSPSGGRTVVDGGVYYLLSTAPGRVDLDWETLGEEEFMRLVRANSFYTYDESSGWQVSTVEDRFISDFDVKDGLLYVVSTGSADSSQASVGVSSDRGQSWSWQDVEMADVDQVTVMATDDQPLVIGSRWGNADYDEAIALAASAGVDITPMTLYNVDGQGFTYVPIAAENRCDFILSQFLPGFAEMEEFAASEDHGMSDEEFAEMREQELFWITEEVEANGCSMPEELGKFGTFDPVAIPDPVTKSWEGLGLSVPESWSPATALYRFDGQDLQPLDLPYSTDEVQTGYTTKADGQMTVHVYDQSAFYDGSNGPEGETVFLTRNGEDWTEEFRPYPQSEEDEAALYYDGSDYHPPVVGDRSFRMWWDEMAFEEPVDDQDWIEPTPEFQIKIGSGPWQTIPLEAITGGTDVGDRQAWDVQGSPLGVFLVFGPRWDPETGEPGEESQLVFYTGNGVDWESIELDGQSFWYTNNDNELLAFVGDYDHDGENESVTETYLIRPKR